MTRDRNLLKAGRFIGGIVVWAAYAGCVSEPATPDVSVQPPPPLPDTNVYFYPAQGQSAEQQDRDKYECNGWAVRQSGFDPSSPNVPPHLRVLVSAGGPPPGAGVAAGAVTGAVLGAALSRPWEAGPGALIGALAGAGIGGLAETTSRTHAQSVAGADARDAEAALLEQKARNYRRAMSACLEGRGYSVR